MELRQGFNSEPKPGYCPDKLAGSPLLRCEPQREDWGLIRTEKTVAIAPTTRMVITTWMNTVSTGWD